MNTRIWRDSQISISVLLRLCFAKQMKYSCVLPLTNLELLDVKLAL